jgi:hypothetical protein
MSPEPADRAKCPLCGQANGCAMEAPGGRTGAQPPCWCTTVDFSAELLEQLPPQARGRACICRACAQPGAPG